MTLLNIIVALLIVGVGNLKEGYRESLVTSFQAGRGRGELGIYRGPGTPQGPQSIRAKDVLLYILDTENGRVVALDTAGRWLFTVDISEGSGRSGNDLFIKKDTLFVIDIGARELRGYINGKKVKTFSFREWARMRGRPIPLPRVIHYIGRDFLLGALFYFAQFEREDGTLKGPSVYDEVKNGNTMSDSFYFAFERDLVPIIKLVDFSRATLQEWTLDDPEGGVIEEVLYLGSDSKGNLYFECFYRTDEPLWNSEKALLMIDGKTGEPAYIVTEIPYSDIYLMTARDMALLKSGSVFFMDMDTTGVRLIKWWRKR